MQFFLFTLSILWLDSALISVLLKRVFQVILKNIEGRVIFSVCLMIYSIRVKIDSILIFGLI